MLLTQQFCQQFSTSNFSTFQHFSHLAHWKVGIHLSMACLIRCNSAFLKFEISSYVVDGGHWLLHHDLVLQQELLLLWLQLVAIVVRQCATRIIAFVRIRYIVRISCGPRMLSSLSACFSGTVLCSSTCTCVFCRLRTVCRNNCYHAVACTFPTFWVSLSLPCFLISKSETKLSSLATER